MFPLGKTTLWLEGEILKNHLRLTKRKGEISLGNLSLTTDIRHKERFGSVFKNTIILCTVALVAILGIATVSAVGGFDEFGYNRTARIFEGPASGWCLQRGAPANCLGAYSDDHLTMKWNAEWDRGNDENWANPPYNATLNNEWNGNVPGGSGWSEVFKTVWDAGCAADGTPSRSDSWCIWGQFAVLMDHGTDPSHVHEWWTLANPVGYGAQ